MAWCSRDSVERAPRVALSGGRYDKLMRKFGKAGDGLGFALYLDWLQRVLARPASDDVDVLVLYSARRGARCFCGWRAQGAGPARAGSTDAAPGLRAGRTMRYRDGALEERAAHAERGALPRDGLATKVYRLFKAAGYDTVRHGAGTDTRLVLTDEKGDMSYLLVKPRTWPSMWSMARRTWAWWARTRAFLEGGSDVYELLDWALANAAWRRPRPWASGGPPAALRVATWVSGHRPALLPRRAGKSRSSSSTAPSSWRRCWG